ncbi:sensor histidine kinase [Homoserinimonas sp. A447]
MRSRRAPLETTGPDVVLGVALGAVGVAETFVVLGGSQSQFAVVALSMAAPIIWRRAHPYIVSSVLVLALVAQLAFASIRVFDQTFTGYVCIVIAMYSVGRHGGDRRPGVIGLCVLTTGVTIALHDASLVSGMLALILTLVPALLGAAIQARIRITSVLEEQSALLAASAEVVAAAEATTVRSQLAAQVQMVVNHEVLLMTVQAEEAKHLASSDPIGAAELIAAVEHRGRRALTDLRRLVGIMREGDDGATLPPADSSGSSGAPEIDRTPTSAATSRPERHGIAPAARWVSTAGAMILVAIAAAESGFLAGGRSEPVAIASLTGALIAAPLLMRRAYPLGASVACWVIAGGLAAFLPVPFFSLSLIAVLLAYSVGAFSAGLRSVMGVTIGLCGVIAVNVLSGIEQWGDYAFPAALVAAAWFAGKMVAKQGRLTAAAVDRAEEVKRLRDLRAATAAMSERLLIARELHDVVAHTLMVMVVQCGAARRTLEAGRAGWPEALDIVMSTGASASAELDRLMSVDPGTPGIAGVPGLDQVPSLAERIRTAGCEVELRIGADTTALGNDLQSTVYRIVQEALTNVLRHSGPTHVLVLIERRAEHLVVVVSDAGSRMPRSDRPDGNGNGIAGMQERARLHGGQLSAHPLAGGGFVVRATLPTSVMAQEQPA